MTTAKTAYQTASRHRSQRDQEADVFLRVNARLRGAERDGGQARVRALADNDRLWVTVMDLMRDPANPLPLKLRASVISVGLAVQRETRRDDPDLGFIIGVNEQIAAGLSGAA